MSNLISLHTRELVAGLGIAGIFLVIVGAVLAAMGLRKRDGKYVNPAMGWSGVGLLSVGALMVGVIGVDEAFYRFKQNE